MYPLGREEMIGKSLLHGCNYIICQAHHQGECRYALRWKTRPPLYLTTRRCIFRHATSKSLGINDLERMIVRLVLCFCSSRKSI
jgi:hypothetical protein